MPRATLFGVPIAWSCEGLPFDPLAGLLEMLADPPVADEPARVRFVLGPASPAAAADPAESGYPCAFYQGIIRAYRVPEKDGNPSKSVGFLLWEQASRVRFHLSTSLVDAEIAPEASEITPGSAHSMLEIALALVLRREGLF